MALEKIISISGQTGLFQVISQTKYGLIAESLENGKRIPVYSNVKVSSLGDISIYTDEGEVPLNDAFLKLKELQKGETVSFKNDDEVKKIFESILPTYDRERVYASDMKKLLKWYNALLSKDLIQIEEAEESSEEITTEASEEITEKKPVKKAAAKTKTGVDKKAAPKSAAPKAASKSKGASKVSAPRKAQ